MTVAPNAPGVRRRALLFVGGVRDAAMQLGVAHAMLVARSAPPDFLVGVSAGAVNAAATAEILQAGPPGLSREERHRLSPDQRLPFQVDKLRQFVDAYVDLPRTVIGTLLPDSLEILARDPFDPLELPIHFDTEREAREVANEAKAGVVSVLNDIFAVKLSVGSATRIARRILGWIAAADLPGRGMEFWSRLSNEAGLLALFWMRYRETAPLVARVCWAYIIGPNHTVLRGFQRSATADHLMKRVERTWNPLRISLEVLFTLHLYAAATMGWLLSVLVRVAALPLPKNGGAGRFAAVRQALLAPWRWVQDAFQPPLQRILGYYGLADGIANTDALKQLFVRCFDQAYYGRTTMTGVLDRALDHNNRPAKSTDLYRKRLEDYQRNDPPIHVAAVATALKEGKLRAIDKSVPVVEALLAATAVVPFFPAVQINEHHERTRAVASRAHLKKEREEARQRERRWKKEKAEAEKARAEGRVPAVVNEADAVELGQLRESPGSGEWFINGGNLSNEAIGPLMNYLRTVLVEQKDKSTGVDVYRASALPLSSSRLPVEGEFDGVLDVVPRALQLKKFRDATVEQQLTHLYTKTLPSNQSFWVHPKTKEVFVNATIYPIELEKTSDLESRLLAGEKVEYRELLYETIADGCKATIETTMPALIRRKAGDALTTSCSGVIDARLNGAPRLPGGKDETGPGITEICKRCALYRGPSADQWRDRKMLRICESTAPDWPVHDRRQEVQFIRPEPQKYLDVDLGAWPQKREGMLGNQRALVSLLFGGGVFRGVFHMGVLTALNDVGVYPDVVAGSSVGSIIAAMIAQVFSNPLSRQREIAHLAATFLTIDRLILTDRFADFIRRLTLHAADTRFSPRDLDLVFRRYDSDGGPHFSRRSRTVSAGIERLVNISPFELFELARHLRIGQVSNFLHEITRDVQAFLDRSGVPKEILGSEPLALLIQNHVLSGRRADDPVRDEIFESFRDCGIYFLATATNLNKGELEVLGEETLAADKEPSILYGLLASSAFPAVFRPRQSWEIFRQTEHIDHYIDGGVIDNLPLDAVARFLDRASRTSRPDVLPRVARRPKRNNLPVPHLIFTASLEVDPAVACDVGTMVRDCIQLWKHSQTLQYNRKIDAFAKTQRDLRTIFEANPGAEPPVDLHVLAVKPKWLCSTFGFHPMLGFRRRKQAQSIAHGCASTLAAIYQFQIASDAPSNAGDWLRSWGICKGDDFDRACFEFTDRRGRRLAAPKSDSACQLKPDRRRSEGGCWFRETTRCPYSRQALLEAGVADEKINEITRIYALCGLDQTHQPAAGG